MKWKLLSIVIHTEVEERIIPIILIGNELKLFTANNPELMDLVGEKLLEREEQIIKPNQI